jgi:hypothetical protein
MGLDVHLTFPAGQGMLFEPNIETTEVFWANYTHNVGPMAAEAFIYRCVWRPEMIGITKAWELIEPLREGIRKMRAYPYIFKRHDPPNGWGSYDTFVPWLERYLVACETYPDADVSVSR